MTRREWFTATLIGLGKAAVVAAGASALLAGCGDPRGAMTLGNIFQGYPTKILGVGVNLEASLLQVRFQPYNAEEVRVEGWFFVPSDATSSNRRRIEFANDVISGIDTRDGTGLFVIASYDWPDGWDGNAMAAGIKYFFMITVHDGDRTKVEVWQHINGATTHIARSVADDVATYKGREYKLTGLAQIAQMIPGHAEIIIEGGRAVLLEGIALLPRLSRGIKPIKDLGAKWYQRLLDVANNH